MNRILRRLLGVFCLVLVTASLAAAPAVADPGNPPVWPPVNNSVIVVPSSPDTGTTAPAPQK